MSWTPHPGHPWHTWLLDSLTNLSTWITNLWGWASWMSIIYSSIIISYNTSQCLKQTIFSSTGALFSLSGWTGGQRQMPGFDSNPRPSAAPSPCSTVSSSLKLRNRSEKSSEYKRILLLRCILIAKATKQRMFNIVLLLQMLWHYVSI